MAEVKSTTIVPIVFYCILLAVYFLFLAINTVINNKTGVSNSDVVLWLSVVAEIIFAGGLICVGIGILYLNQLCWKILFFSLAICVSSVSSLIFVFLISLFIDVKFLDPYVEIIKTSSSTWLSCMGVFLSEIIVLYYLSSKEVVACFGEMGPLISPF